MNSLRFSLSEVLSALSHALDLAEGQTLGHSLRSCMIGMRLGQEAGLDSDQLSALYYALLLKDSGCSANSAQVAQLFASDDPAVKRAFKTVDWTRPLHVALYATRHAAVGQSLPDRLKQLFSIAGNGRAPARDLVRIRCDRGAAIAANLGFPEETATAIRSLDEHWDGRGSPEGLTRRDIPLLARIAGLAQCVEVFLSDRGVDGALRVIRARSGSWFDPELVDLLMSFAGDRRWWIERVMSASERTVQAQEPEDRVRSLDQKELDAVSETFAEVIDAKSPFTHGHSAGVAQHARALARELELGAHTEAQLYRAGLLHDIGKLGVSNRILDKPGRLDPHEQEAVREHPRHTWHILSRVEAFSDFARIASEHHERIDGSGYPWGMRARELGMASRVLVVADVFDALCADRPYRFGMPVEEALSIIRREAGSGLDADVVNALERHVAPSGEPAKPPAQSWSAPASGARPYARLNRTHAARPTLA